jgi:hypothetical protein
VAGNAEDSRIDIGIVAEWRQFSLRFVLAVCVLRREAPPDRSL